MAGASGLGEADVIINVGGFQVLVLSKRLGESSWSEF